jgi:DNA-binding protein YbaB
MDDDRARIDTLREELDVELQTAEQARAQVGPAAGSDATGSVTVHLDADGQVTQVVSDGSWRQRLEPEALPGAVLEAYTAAAQDREVQYVTAVGAAEPDRARPHDSPEVRAYAEISDEVRQRADQLPQSTLVSIFSMLDDLERSFDAAFEMVDERLTATSTGRSTSGHAQAEVSGNGDLVGVTYDERWLSGAHPFNVGRETTEAIHDAIRQQAGRSVQAIAEASGLARLQHLSRDSGAMARHLGL